jgi:hypothetical protein
MKRDSGVVRVALITDDLMVHHWRVVLQDIFCRVFQASDVRKLLQVGTKAS